MQIQNAVMIFRSMVNNAPILKKWGCLGHRPISLVCPNSNISRTVAERISYRPVYADVNTPFKELQDSVKGLRAQGLFCLLRPELTKLKAKEMEFVDNMTTFSSFGRIGNVELAIPIFWLLTKNVPELIMKESQVVFLDDESVEEQYDYFELLPDVADLTYIREEIKNFLDDDALPLKAAVAFMLPKLKAKGEMDFYEELLDDCEKIISVDNYYKSDESFLYDFEDAFLKVLSQSSTKKYRLPNVPSCETEFFEEKIFYSNDFVYISEVNFKKIFKDLYAGMGCNVFKRKLTMMGVILSEHDRYTVRMGYRCNGISGNQRMIRMSLDLLHQVYCCLI